MDDILDTQNFARRPGIPRMRSQRIVHVVQTEKTYDVSVVTLSEDGHAEQAEEVVDFSAVGDADEASTAHIKKVANEVAKEKQEDSFFFGVDFDNGAVEHLASNECEYENETTRSRKGSLFSDDEFEPIRMKLPKRPPPLPLRLPDRKDERHSDEIVPSPECSPAASSEDSNSNHDSHGGSAQSARFDHSQTVLAKVPSSETAASESTLFSVPSASSSTTCVDYNIHPKSAGRPFFHSYDEKDLSPKVIEVVTPDSVTGTRGLVDLRVYGYDFNWSRFAGRSETAHGLSPEDSAELEMFLSRGPKAFPSLSTQKPQPKKNTFEKKLLGVFKLGA